MTLFVPSFPPTKLPYKPEIKKANLSPEQAKRFQIIEYDAQSEMPGDPNEAKEDDLLWGRWSWWLADEFTLTYRTFLKGLKKHNGGGEGLDREVDVAMVDGLVHWGFLGHLPGLCENFGMKVPKVWSIGPVSMPYMAR